MHKSRQLFHSLIQNCSDVITILSTEGTILYESPSIERLFGYKPNELIGRNVFEMLCPEDLPSCMTAFAGVTQNPSHSLSVEFRFPHKDGSWRVLEATGSNQLNNPLIAGIVLNSRDITERQVSEERFRRIFEDGPLGMFISSPDYKVLRTNKAFREMLGYTEEELVGCSIEDVTHPEDIEASVKLSRQVLKGKIAHFHLEKRYVKKNREILWINVTFTAIRGQHGEVLYALGMVEDITGRKAAEQERVWLIEELQDSLDNIKTLRGLLPMCAWCKKIREDSGYWKKVETYIQEHSDASFTHGICPDCLKEHDPHTYEKLFTSEEREWGSKIERRQFERRRVRSPLNYVFSVSLGKSERAILNATIKDISDAGMCIRTDWPLERECVLTITNGGADKSGIVRWRKIDTVDHKPYRVGIQLMQ